MIQIDELIRAISRETIQDNNTKFVVKIVNARGVLWLAVFLVNSHIIFSVTCNQQISCLLLN